MLNDALILFRKEAGNVIKDGRAVFANFILPLLMFPLIFGALGSIDRIQSDAHRAATYRISWVGPRDQLLEKNLRAQLSWTEDLAPGNAEGLTLTLPAGHVPGTPAVLQVAYDSTRQDMGYAYGVIRDAVEAYNAALAPPVPKPLTVQAVDLARPEAAGAGLLAFLFPYLVVLLLFAGAMNLGLAVTVGEKEKGSLAVLLVNQVSRTSIALGKVLFVMAAGLVNIVMTSVGIVGGLLIQGFLSGPSSGGGFGLGALGDPSNVAVALVSVLVASVLSSSIVVWIGVVSRTMKQAGGYITPVYMVVMVGAIAGSSFDPATNQGLYLIPLLNTTLILKSAVLGNLQADAVLLVNAVNAALGGLLVWRTARAFGSEEVLSTT